MANDFSTGKSIFILAIVAGCFAILWPNIFYPMLVGSYEEKNGYSSGEHLKQERPPHLRPDLMHPALREKGRAIPQSHVVPKVTVQEGRPGPIPGLRPPMGGAGHVVPPPKGSGTMGIVMPMYTIGIVVFFLYTMMKLMFKKSDEPSSYDGFISDPDFRRAVFENTSHHQYVKNKEIIDDGSKLGDLELDMLKKKLQETEKAMERIVAKMMSLPHNSLLPKDGQAEEVTDTSEDKVLPISDTNENAVPEAVTEIPEDDSETKGGSVKVVGMEMTESVEGGAKWSRPPTPLSRPSTPQNIYLPGSVPSQSQLLVSDSHTETQSEDNSVVLTGKVTLSLIGLLEKDTKEESYITETDLEPKPDLNIETKDDQDREENKEQEKAKLKKDGDSSIKEN